MSDPIPQNRKDSCVAIDPWIIQPELGESVNFLHVLGLMLLRITSGFGEGDDVRHGGGKEASGRNALAHVFYLCSISMYAKTRRNPPADP